MRWIDGLLGGFRVQEEAHYWYSIFLAEEPSDSARRSKPYHIMYKGGRNHLRTFHLKTLGRTLLAEIQAVTSYGQKDAIYVDCALISVDGSNALIAGDWVWFLHNLGRRVERSGITLPVATTTAIDHRTGKAVPSSSRLRIPPGAIDRLDEIAPDDGPGERSVLDRRTFVDFVCLPGWPEELIQPISKVKAVHEMVHRTLNIRETRGVALQGLARLAEQSPCYEVRSVTAPELLAGLKEAAAAHTPVQT
jgi:hypothetical protein